MDWLIWIAIIGATLVAIARIRASFQIWTAVVAGILLLTGIAGLLTPLGGTILWILFLLVAIPLNVPELRRKFLSDPALARVRTILPPMSETEKQAIEAGTVWWDAQLFRGDPDWRQLLDTPAPRLSPEEQAFLDGPTEELCAMLDEWRICHELNDLAPEAWEFIKQRRFFGMIIPKQYGGLEFSAQGNSAVVQKIASRSISGAVTVMVPNSLGPAELLLEYGTEAQKNHYLPRLANGEEIPCFALTGVWAGSDAASLPDHGIVCKGEYNGEEVLGLRVNWEKRYITLAPVATVIGLAFRALDPDHLLGAEEDLGITCALIPVTAAGVEVGRRHRPAHAAFHNGPTTGRDVFVPMEWIIGGQDRLGQGWRMLMESLAAGRGISLPALSTGGGKFASRITGAYARVRKQFRLPIGRFEGVEEALARIGGLTYMMEGARLLTTTAIDQGEKPSVVTAMVKYHLTESMRQAVNDAMDIHGGRGICTGPSNYLNQAYQSIPISITVEGANILTRTMIIFGQGAMRCHPYLLREVDAAAQSDPATASEDFDEALFGHLGYTVTNAARAFVYGLSNGALAPVPSGVATETLRYYRRLARISAAFALLADVALLSLGGALKRKEKLSGRFADVLSFMYLGSATLKHFEDTQRPREDLPFVQWACEHCLHRAESALDGILRNFPVPVVGLALRPLIMPLGRRCQAPADAVGHKVASALLTPSATRDRLTQGIYISAAPEDVAGRVEHALTRAIAAEPVERKLRQAGAVQPPELDLTQWTSHLVDEGLISAEEADVLREAHTAVRAAIMVDDFAASAARGEESAPAAA